MKKLQECYVLLMLVVSLPMIMSCSKDDDDTPQGTELVKQAIGTWMCTDSRDIQQNGMYYDGLMVGKQVTIKSDGTFTSTASTFGYSGTYTVSGNKITAKSTSGTFVIIVSVKGNTMTWDGTASNGVRFNYTFIRE